MKSFSDNGERHDKPFLGLIFDLDDTLFDTTAQLIEPAAREMCAAMIAAGMKAELEDALHARLQILEENPRAEVIDELVARFGGVEDADKQKIKEAGFQAFYAREVSQIHSFTIVPELLMKLHNDYELFLVTLGSPPTQRRKVELLQITSFFTKIYFVDISVHKGKVDALADILAACSAPASRFLSIGNRLDKDLAPAKRVGMKTCWIRHGEHSHMRPTCGEELPDFQIQRLEELVETCSL